MTKDEALDLALEALLWANIEINDWRDSAYGYESEDQPQIMEAITAIKQARSAPVQEPVSKHYVDGGHLVYPAAQRQWVGLTDEEFEDIELGCRSTSSGKIEAMQKVEAKLKEKNT
jgi:hypothetical protein